MSVSNLRLDGTSCGRCVTSMKNALSGVTGLQVNLVQVCSAEVEFNADTRQIDEILETIRMEGFAPSTELATEDPTS